MTHTYGFFESLDADDTHSRVASRQAASVIKRRAQVRFAAFLATASNEADFLARVDLVDDDLQELAVLAAAEFTIDEDEAYRLARTTLLAGGGFCDDCRKWKSGPNAGCTCGDGKSESDEPAEDEEDADEESEPKEAAAHLAFDVVPLAEGDLPPLNEHIDFEAKHLDSELDDAPSAVGYGTLASDNTGLSDKPSPKMDKSKGHPKAPDTDGGRYKTETQDIDDEPDHSKEPELEGAKGKMEKALKKVEEQKGPHTDTWSGKGGQANPVTKSADYGYPQVNEVQRAGMGAPPMAPESPHPTGQPSTAVGEHMTCQSCGQPINQGDPQCVHCGAPVQQQSVLYASTGNPIQDVLESGWVPDAHVQTALARYHTGMGPDPASQFSPVPSWESNDPSNEPGYGQERPCRACGATEFGGVCSNPQCDRSRILEGPGSELLHPNEFGGPRDPQATQPPGGDPMAGRGF